LNRDFLGLLIRIHVLGLLVVKQRCESLVSRPSHGIVTHPQRGGVFPFRVFRGIAPNCAKYLQIHKRGLREQFQILKGFEIFLMDDGSAPGKDDDPDS